MLTTEVGLPSATFTPTVRGCTMVVDMMASTISDTMKTVIPVKRVAARFLFSGFMAFPASKTSNPAMAQRTVMMVGNMISSMT